MFDFKNRKNVLVFGMLEINFRILPSEKMSQYGKLKIYLYLINIFREINWRIENYCLHNFLGFLKTVKKWISENLMISLSKTYISTFLFSNAT